MTIAQWQARQIVKSAKIMGDFVRSTSPDKLDWRPQVDSSSQTQSVLEMVGECIYANQRAVAILSRLPLPPRPDSFGGFESTEQAIDLLNSSASGLSEIVTTLTNDDLAATYPTHRGNLSGAMVCLLVVRNMTYHIGQINMIQLLYGDTEFHITPDFLTA